MIKSLYPIFQRWSVGGSVYIVGDTHFGDPDKGCMGYMLSDEQLVNTINSNAKRHDTLIILGDVGDPTYVDRLKAGHKVLISGNHDSGKVFKHFDEVYRGPLFIADRIVLSHEPIFGLEDFCINIHGHCHMESHSFAGHLNMVSIVTQEFVLDLGTSIKEGFLSDVPNIHRLTIDKAKAEKDG